MKPTNSCILLPLLIITLQLCFETVNCDKILVLAFFATKSHKITYMRLIEELARKGHEITVVSPIKPTKSVPNIKEIYTIDVNDFILNKIDAFKVKANNEKFNPLNFIDDFEKICLKTYKLPQVMELLNESFDLAFMSPIMNECALGIVWKLKLPLVLFSPASAPDFITSKISSRLPPSFVPNILLDYPNEMNFQQRFVNFGMNLLYDLGSMFLYEPRFEKLYREQLQDEGIPSIREILANASLILSNGHFSLSGPRPYLPDVIDVGGIHSRPAKKLPEDLDKFVSKKGSKGFIYFSMGTIINTQQMPDEKREMFLNVFAKLKDFQIVWKWWSADDEKMKKKSDNVLLSSWLPQQDILGHEKIVLFINHCGMGGVEESIYNGVPLLGMPIQGDQPLNAKMGKRLGILHEVDWNELTEDILYEAIKEVLDNKKYKENAMRLSAIFKDQPDEPLTRGVYWIEYVLRHKGAPHLRSAARKLNYFQYHSWDIIGTYLTLIFVIIWVLSVIVKRGFRMICSLFFGGKKDKNVKEKRN